MPMNRETPTPGNAPVNTVVMGASLVDCMAAAAAAQCSDRVTLIEKGEFGDDVGDRQSVPQEKHVHLLLLRGTQVLERFFPGIVGELEGAGAVAVDQGHGVKWLQRGRWKQRYPTGICAHYCSRGLIDRQV